MTWTTERVETLRRLASIPELSASQIGIQLNVSRCAVIGKCKREKIILPLANFYFSLCQNGGRKSRARQARQSVPRRSTPGGGFLTPPDSSTNCTLLELQTNSCRWPIGEAGNLKYCGAPKKDHSPYCGFHHLQAYVPARQYSEKELERRTRWITKVNGGWHGKSSDKILPMEAAE